MASTDEPQTRTGPWLERLTPESRLELYPLVSHYEDDQYIVGRLGTGEFVTLPEVGWRAIMLLRRGYPLKGIGARLYDLSGEEVDLYDFVVTLIDLGFVRAIDGHIVGTDETPKPSLTWLRPQYVRWIFSRPLKAFYFLFLTAAGLTLITHLDLLPGYQDFIWSPITSLVIVVNTSLSCVSLALHELAHLVAARSLGVPASVRFSTRLQYLVLHTDVTGLWAVPRRRRYRVYLAGVALDLALISIAILLLAYTPLPELAQNLLSALILINVLGIVWQCYIYMRTDFYFVLMDFLHCHNLFGDSLAYLRHFVRALRRQVGGKARAGPPADPLASLPAHERRKVRLYAWLMVIGSAVSLGTFAGFGLPVTVKIFSDAGGSLVLGLTTGQPLMVLDGVVTLAVVGGLEALFLVLFLKGHRGKLETLLRRLGLYRTRAPAEAPAVSVGQEAYAVAARIPAGASPSRTTSPGPSGGVPFSSPVNPPSPITAALERRTLSARAKPSPAASQAAEDGRLEAAERFRHLISTASQGDSDGLLSEAISAQLPEEARELLGQRHETGAPGEATIRGTGVGRDLEASAVSPGIPSEEVRLAKSGAASRFQYLISQAAAGSLTRPWYASRPKPLPVKRPRLSEGGITPADPLSSTDVPERFRYLLSWGLEGSSSRVWFQSRLTDLSRTNRLVLVGDYTDATRVDGG